MFEQFLKDKSELRKIREKDLRLQKRVSYQSSYYEQMFIPQGSYKGSIKVDKAGTYQALVPPLSFEAVVSPFIFKFTVKWEPRAGLTSHYIDDMLTRALQVIGQYP